MQCQGEMEQDHRAKAPGQAEAWEEVRAAAAVEAVVLQQVRVGIASARTVVKGVAHRLETPCFEQQCPKCGTAMTRE